jgi:hypothetical protein
VPGTPHHSRLLWGPSLRVVKQRQPTREDAVEAERLLLAAVVGDTSLDAAFLEIAALHPRNNTFPGEVFIALAADAIEAGGWTRRQSLSHEEFRERFLADHKFSGREHQKLRYAMLAAAAVHGGVEPDLLDEVPYWGTDDFWQFAALAAIGYIRAAAERRRAPVQQLCDALTGAGVRSAERT